MDSINKCQSEKSNVFINSPAYSGKSTLAIEIQNTYSDVLVYKPKQIIVVDCNILIIDDAHNLDIDDYKTIKKCTFNNIYLFGDIYQANSDHRFFTKRELYSSSKWTDVSLSCHLPNPICKFINDCCMKPRMNSDITGNKVRYNIDNLFSNRSLDIEIQHYNNMGYSYSDIVVFSASPKSVQFIKPKKYSDKGILFSTFKKAKNIKRKITIIYGLDSSYSKYFNKDFYPFQLPTEIYISITRSMYLSVMHHNKNNYLPFVNTVSCIVPHNSTTITKPIYNIFELFSDANEVLKKYIEELDILWKDLNYDYIMEYIDDNGSDSNNIKWIFYNNNYSYSQNLIKLIHSNSKKNTNLYNLKTNKYISLNTNIIDNVLLRMNLSCTDDEFIENLEYNHGTNIIVLDCETDGENTVVQIAYNIYDENLNLIEKNNDLIYNGSDKTDYFKKISICDIKKYGLHPKVALTKLNDKLKSCRYIIGHNIAFDMRKITYYSEKYGINILFPPEIDTMKISIDVVCAVNKNGTRKVPNLNELYFHLFNANMNNNAHLANYDVDVTFDCFKKLVDDNLYTIQ